MLLNERPINYASKTSLIGWKEAPAREKDQLDSLEFRQLLNDPGLLTESFVLRPWTFDFHVAQNDGTVHGTGSHDKTGRHCQANDPNGKLDIAQCATYWLKDAAARGMKHICWDGCMFDNSVLQSPGTWNEVLKAMIAVDEAL